MLKVSNLTDYSVLILSLFVESEQEYLTTIELTKLSSLPTTTISKVLVILVKHGLLSSVRGKNGGYKLNKKPEDIKLKEIFNIFDDKVRLTNCLERDCIYMSKCNMFRAWSYLSKKIDNLLENISLRDMVTMKETY